MPLNSSVNREHVGENRTESSSTYASKLAPAGDVIVGLTILTLVLFSILGNGLVLLISYRRRKKIMGSELLCVNLAVVDFLSCIFFYPLSILSSFNHAWLGHNVTCIYYGLGCFIFGLCGMFTIAAISVIRYLKTCYSLVYALRLEGANIRLVCLGTWVLATAWSCLPLFGWGEYVPEPYGLSCTIAWRGYHSSFKDAFYVICSFACFTLVPVLIIVMSQCQILYKISRFSYTLSARGIRTNLRHAEKRLSLMFFCISLGFVIAWAPYAVVSFLFIFQKENWMMAPEGFVFPALFAKSSHVYNPFIYFYFNKAFRHELGCLLRSLCPGLVGKKVGICTATALQVPHPIHIQLQEQVRGQGESFRLSHGKSINNSWSKRTGSNHLQDRVIYPCWGPKVTPSNVERESMQESLPIST